MSQSRYPKLLIIDGSNLAYRAYFAAQQYKRKTLQNPDLSKNLIEIILMEETGIALIGMVKKLLKKYQPSHAAIVFDDNRSSTTFRAKLFPEYKSARKSKPLHKDAFKLFKAIIKDVGVIPIDIPENYEADDMIGSMAVQLSPYFDCTYIHSGDKDFMQLPNDDEKSRIRLLYSGNGKICKETVMDVAGVKKALHIRPKFVVDYKAIVGDPSDGYPGVYKIGPRRAVKLLHQYQSLENIYSHLEQIKEKSVRLYLEQGRESAFLCQKLAQIVTDLELQFEIDDLVVEQNLERLDKRLQNLRPLSIKILTFD